MELVGGRGGLGRGLAILVLLVALLSMHGLQSLSAGPGPQRPAAAGVDHGLDVVAGGPLDLVPVELTDLLVATVASGPAALASAVPAGTVPGHSDTVPGHGLAAHVWSLCLAVLLAGLALLGAALARRRAAVTVREPVSRTRGTLHRSRLPRPPDLSALCLLRI